MNDLAHWREAVGLQSDLLSDADREVAMRYGAARSAQQEKADRISILVGADGVVLKAYDSVDAATHPQAALLDARGLTQAGLQR